MSDIVDEFNAYRSKMNDKILGENSKLIKRIFNLDSNAYRGRNPRSQNKRIIRIISLNSTSV